MNRPSGQDGAVSDTSAPTRPAPAWRLLLAGVAVVMIVVAVAVQ